MLLDLFSGIKDELRVVEEELIKTVRSSDPILTETATDLIMAGGKRLRPALCLMGAKFADFELDKVLPLAVALELSHMATLVHDDVVDAALTRRGKPTVKAQWGNRISIHIGDYLMGKCLILVSTFDNPLIYRELGGISVKMSEGEIYQILTSYDLEQNIKDYFYRINRKTALLISASCQLGAVACDAPRQLHQTLRRFGHYIGMAFQITDDILDMTADQTELGKPIGGDLQQGIITLPTIYALRQDSVRGRLKEIIGQSDKSDQEVHEAIDLIVGCGGIDYAEAIASNFIAKAKEELNSLPDKPIKKTMQAAAEFIGVRSF